MGFCLKNGLSLGSDLNLPFPDLQTVPHATPDADFRYTLVETPKHGRLLLSAMGQDLSTAGRQTANVVGPASAKDRHNSPVQMTVDSKFTQLDLLAGHLKYKLTSSAAGKKPVEDAFKFRHGNAQFEFGGRFFILF